jgi:hypothetical protein
LLLLVPTPSAGAAGCLEGTPVVMVVLLVVVLVLLMAVVILLLMEVMLLLMAVMAARVTASDLNSFLKVTWLT